MQPRKLKVGLFVGGTIDQFCPQTGEKLKKLLLSEGIACHYATDVTDSGRLLYFAGDENSARSLSKQMLKYYADDDYVVAADSSDVAYFRHFASRLFRDAAQMEAYESLCRRFVHITDFLVGVLDYRPAVVPFVHKVAVMDHCTTLRDYGRTILGSKDSSVREGLQDEPRQLLKAIPSLTLAEMEQREVCCGQADFFPNRFTPVAVELAHLKVQHALDAGAEYLVSTESSCILRLGAYCAKHGIPLKCKHIIDVLGRRM